MMKAKKNKQFLFVVCVGVLAGVSSVWATELARVNQTSITEEDVKLSMVGMNEGAKQGLLSDRHLQRKMVSAVVDQEILAQEAVKLGMDQTPEFKKKMEVLRRQELANQVLERKIDSQLTPSALKQHYEDHLNLFGTDLVRVQHILLKDEQEARRVMGLAKAPGADFQALAEQYSRDPSAKNNRGELGYMGRGWYTPEINQAAFSAASGEVVGPIVSTFGYHVIKVIEKRFGKPLEFHEVEMRVRESLRAQLIQKHTRQLRQVAQVQIQSK